jgi:hypothetical protein
MGADPNGGGVPHQGPTDPENFADFANIFLAVQMIGIIDIFLAERTKTGHFRPDPVNPPLAVPV